MDKLELIDLIDTVNGKANQINVLFELVYGEYFCKELNPSRRNEKDEQSKISTLVSGYNVWKTMIDIIWDIVNDIEEITQERKRHETVDDSFSDLDMGKERSL